MSSGQKAAYEHDEDLFWSSEEGKIHSALMKESNSLLGEWNSLVGKIDTIRFTNITIGDFNFLMTCKKLFLYRASDRTDKLIDKSDLDRLRNLVSK